jgi:hypothetical protein
MIELVDKESLIKGVKYHVKREKQIVHSRCIKEFDCIFDGYSYYEGFAWVKLTDFLDAELILELNKFYRYISKEEYYSKLKKKYDHKCLNIILKRLVDETFQSDYL